MLASGDFNFLAGFENDRDGTGIYFNFIMSNGCRSSQSDRAWHWPHHDYMMPKDAEKMIGSVKIYYHHQGNFIVGFSFFDKHQSLIWQIG